MCPPDWSPPNPRRDAGPHAPIISPAVIVYIVADGALVRGDFTAAALSSESAVARNHNSHAGASYPSAPTFMEYPIASNVVISVAARLRAARIGESSWRRSVVADEARQFRSAGSARSRRDRFARTRIPALATQLGFGRGSVGGPISCRSQYPAGQRPDRSRRSAADAIRHRVRRRRDEASAPPTAEHETWTAIA